MEDTLSYPWGWSPKGTRCLAERLGHKTQWISMPGACCQGKLFSPHIFTDTCNASVVEAWFARQLIQDLHAAQTVILDNAAFHSEKVLRAWL